ncbi:MAG: RAMP superfamily CRISPR-associated protein [Candidatus Helarchaeota archaeon]
MLKINLSNTSTRQLFKKKFYKFTVMLTVSEDNYIFIGTGEEEIVQDSSYFSKKISIDEKIKKISEEIKPMSSTMLLNGKPIIPGSTIKGMIRFFLEHSFKKDAKNQIDSCFIKQAKPKRINEIKNFLKIFGYYPNMVPRREKSPCNSNKACKVCDLFGNSNLASRVIFSDAVPLDNYIIETVDLSTKWREEKRVIGPNSKFKFSINVNNADKVDLVLLYLGMNLHNNGTHLIGFNKFRVRRNRAGNVFHFGKIKLEIIEIREYYNDNKKLCERIYSNPDEIKSFNENIVDELKKRRNIRNIQINEKKGI